MVAQHRLELHFDPLSRRALLSCGPNEYVMPDSYPDRDAARVAAQRYAWEELGFKAACSEMNDACELPVWFR